MPQMSILKTTLPVACRKQFCEVSQGSKQKFWRGIGNFVERASINKKVFQKERKIDKERERERERERESFFFLCTFEIQCKQSLKVCLGNRFSLTVSSHQRYSMKECVLRNFTKFTENHLCQSFFLKKVADLRPAVLLTKRLCFS